MSAGETISDVCVVIPAYKAQTEILGVLEQIPEIVTRIIVVDDACPDGTGELVQKNSKDKTNEASEHSKSKMQDKGEDDGEITKE